MGKRSYANRLQTEMRKQQLSVRKLGKLTDPDDPERGRRRVQRHLSGTRPSPGARAVYSRVLGVPELAEPDEEPSRVPRNLEAVLMETLAELRAQRMERVA